MRIDASLNYTMLPRLKLAISKTYNNGMKYEETEIKLLKIRQCLKDRLEALKAPNGPVLLKEYRQTLVEYWVVEDLLEEHRSNVYFRNSQSR